MFEVLVYVYENYWQADACPQLDHLGRKLSAVGFDPEEIAQALTWLAGLNVVAHNAQAVEVRQESSTPTLSGFTDKKSGAMGALPTPPQPQSPDSLRVYCVAEQDHLGAESLGFVSFLETAGVLPANLREIVVDRAMAVPGRPVSIEDLKIIVLMVFWSAGIEPDALVLDELCDDNNERIAH
jgi:Smg protein